MRQLIFEPRGPNFHDFFVILRVSVRVCRFISATEHLDAHTGFESLAAFAESLIARTAIGHDRQGRLLMISLEGDGVGLFRVSADGHAVAAAPTSTPDSASGGGGGGGGAAPAPATAKLLELAERRATRNALEKQLQMFRAKSAAEPQNRVALAAQAELTEQVYIEASGRVRIFVVALTLAFVESMEFDRSESFTKLLHSDSGFDSLNSLRASLSTLSLPVCTRSSCG